MVTHSDNYQKKQYKIMTRKDYIIIAEAINKAETEAESKTSVAYVLADALQKDNPLFDRQKFIKACGAGAAT